jgi:hypothetical protein
MVELRFRVRTSQYFLMHPEFLQRQPVTLSVCWSCSCVHMYTYTYAIYNHVHLF